MFGFNDAIKGLLGDLGAEVQIIPVNHKFEEFKQWASKYVAEHSELDPDHQTLEQILNVGTVDELEQLLRHNHEYCDECFLKMYRKYASGEVQHECGCGAPADVNVEPPEPGG